MIPNQNAIARARLVLLVVVLASSIFDLQVLAQSPGQSVSPPVAAARSHYQPDRFAGKAGRYYALIWGIDSLNVRSVEAGEIIRFTYRVVDANKAKELNNKKFNPVLNDPQAGVQLVVPSVANVGMLRQAPSTTEAGKSYWVAFSNKSRPVKRGDRVDVVIGSFHADGLVVD
jgi:hypothetical protein